MTLVLHGKNGEKWYVSVVSVSIENDGKIRYVTKDINRTMEWNLSSFEYIAVIAEGETFPLYKIGGIRMKYRGFEYEISSMKSVTRDGMVYFAETTPSSEEWFKGMGDSEKKARMNIEEKIDRYYDLMERAEKIAIEAKKKGGILYFMDMAIGEFLDCRKGSLEECVEFAQSNVCYEILPDIFHPEPGVEYTVLTNSGEGPRYGNRTYFIPASELTTVKG